MTVVEACEQTLNVILIDDHSLFRAGLAELLKRSGINVSASVSDGRKGIQQILDNPPDIVLLDVRMPAVTGLEVLAELSQALPRLPVVMVTTSQDENDIARALKLGARGYLLKDMEPEQLVDALQAIHRGETVIAPELATALARVLQGKPQTDSTPDRLADLTPRELEILVYIAEGGSNKSIGRELGITDGTVKLHVKSILRKLDVHSRVEAAVIAVEQGLGPRNKAKLK